MSLINRMLRDLSTRQPEPGNVMGGIQLRGAPARRSGASRALLLVVLVAAFTAVLWFFMPKKPALVEVRSDAATQTAAIPATGAATVERFRMDVTMSPPAAGALPAPRQRAKPLQLERSGVGAAVAPPAASASAGNSAKPAERAPRLVSARDAREAQARYNEGRRLLAAGDERGAEQAYTEALALDLHLHPAREDLGSLRIRQGRLDEAERNVRIGLEQDPGWIGYRRLIARLDLAKGRPEAALRVLENAQPSVAADPEFHGLLASTYQRLNRHDDAAREYQALLKAQPNEGHWWAGYGLSRDAMGDRPGALEAFSRARSLGNLDTRLLDHINQRTAVLQSAE